MFAIFTPAFLKMNSSPWILIYLISAVSLYYQLPLIYVDLIEHPIKRQAVGSSRRLSSACYHVKNVEKHDAGAMMQPRLVT